MTYQTMIPRLFFSAFLIIYMVGCITTKTPYSVSNKLYKKQATQYAKLLGQYPVQDSAGLPPPPYFVGTTNFNMRKPSFVIIHHTAQNSCDETLKTFTLERTKVSAHYVICRNGTVHHMLNDYLRAWHAGIGRWGNLTDINSASIGIELDNNGFEPFAEAQMSSLLLLLGRLKSAHGIPTANFIGHADIAPTRKNDPNVQFQWQRLADKGFGHWYEDTTNVNIPLNFNSIHALRIVGYDIKDSTAAITTFKRKFLKLDNNKILNEGDKKILFMLVKKYL
jgi:N-acetylmuramoyl-L-alanine amidase